MIVCIAGLPQFLLDAIQKLGRAGRQAFLRGIGVFFIDPWIEKVSLVGLDEHALADPDYPVGGVLTTKSSAQERVGYAAAQMALEETCIRAHFATYLRDTTPEG